MASELLQYLLTSRVLACLRSPCAYAWCHMALRGTPDLRCPPSARLYPSLLDLLRTCGTVWRTGMTARLWLSERLPRAPVRRGPAGEPARSNSHLSALTMRTVACGCAHHHHHVACAVPGSTLTGTLHASRITPPIMSRLPGLPHARASKVRQTVCVRRTTPTANRVSRPGRAGRHSGLGSCTRPFRFRFPFRRSARSWRITAYTYKGPGQVLQAVCTPSFT